MFKKYLALLSLTCFIFCVSSIVQAEDIPADKVISPKEKLTIRVLEEEAISGPYDVRSDGTLEFPHISKMKVTGLTYTQLAQKIKEELEKELFYQATVTVSAYKKGDISLIQTPTSQGGLIYVYGLVNRPGTIDIPRDEVLTVSKVIIKCGGFQTFANKRGVKLVRKSPTTGKVDTTVLNMVRIIDEGRLEEDLVVHDGDMIVVPEQFFNF